MGGLFVTFQIGAVVQELAGRVVLLGMGGLDRRLTSVGWEVGGPSLCSRAQR